MMVKQKFEVAEALTNAAANLLGISWFVCGFGEMTNRYEATATDVNNNTSTFHATETSELHGWTGRCFCRPNHKLQMRVKNEKGQEILWLDRGCKLGGCFSCCDCCRQEMDVYVAGQPAPGAASPEYLIDMHSPSSGGKIIASIHEPFMGCGGPDGSNLGLSPTLEIMDREGGGVAPSASMQKTEKLIILKANAVCCIGGLCCDHAFQILDGKNPNLVLGTIVKRRPTNQAQTAIELVADSMDNYTISMPQELPPKSKAALLSAVHLIDYWMFEGEGECCSPVNLMRGSVAVKLCNCYCCGCICPIGVRRHGRCCWCPMIT